MIKMFKTYLSSSIGKKQIVAITGIALVLFLFAHLAGNLLIYSGAEAYNGYSQKLHHLGALLWVARIGLLAFFILHFTFTALLVIQNRKARPQSYEKPLHPKTRSLAARIMALSGVVLFIYIISHLCDFTFTSPTPSNSMVNGVDLGLYGLVVNTLSQPLAALWYTIAMVAVGMHLTHAIQSLFQTMGINHSAYTPFIKCTSLFLGIAISLAFGSIPVYLFFSNSTACCFN